MTKLTVNLGEVPEWVRKPDPTIYEWGKPLFLDFETTNKLKGSARLKENRIILACWQHGWDGDIKAKWGGEYQMHELLLDIRRSDFIVAHHAKFELQWLARCGVDLEKVIIYDTMLAEYVIGGNKWKTGQLSLEQVSRRHGLDGKLSVVSNMIRSGVPTEDIPRSWLLRYCKQDVRLLPEIMKRQLRTFSGTRLLPVVYSRCLLTPVLADIENNGLHLDGEAIGPLLTSTEQALSTVETKANKMAEGVNLNSPKQLGTYLYETLGFAEPMRKVRGKWMPDRTPSGGRKTDADTIASLEATTEKQRQFKELFEEARDLSNQLSKYLRKFGDCLREANGVLYANFNQTQTFTHRLSSSGQEYKVQFQNFPRAYKKFFKAPEGWLVGECDGAQLEFRVAGHLGRDVAVIVAVVNGVDVHAFTAKVLTDAGQETDRQDAKPHTFKPLYGGSSGTEAEQAYYKAFKDQYKGVAAAQQTWIDTVLTNKCLETEWGLTYYWPDTRMDRSGYVTNTTSICNYPVQAFATAEIIPLALVCMWHRLKRSNLRMYLVNTVHDSIVAYLPPEETDAYHDLAKQSMIDDVYEVVRNLYGIRLIVPLGCGVKVGERWGVAKEYKYEAAPELYDWFLKENNNSDSRNSS